MLFTMGWFLTKFMVPNRTLLRCLRESFPCHGSRSADLVLLWHVAKGYQCALTLWITHWYNKSESRFLERKKIGESSTIIAYVYPSSNPPGLMAEIEKLKTMNTNTAVPNIMPASGNSQASASAQRLVCFCPSLVFFSTFLWRMPQGNHNISYP